MSRAYETTDIHALPYPENIQRRPGMYVGGTGLDALHHLAYELIDNAVDEALAGHARSVAVTAYEDGSVEVIDDGSGMDEETLERIFEPVYTAKAGMRGVGLGLAIARTYIEANGGKIGVEKSRGGTGKPVHGTDPSV